MPLKWKEWHDQYLQEKRRQVSITSQRNAMLYKNTREYEGFIHHDHWELKLIIQKGFIEDSTIVDLMEQ